MKLAKVLAEKENSSQIFTIAQNASIQNAAQKMVINSIGALIVLSNPDDPKSYSGIITERHIIISCAKSDNFPEKNVGDVMSDQMLITKVDDDVNDIMNIMTKSKKRYVPVWENNLIIGMISIGDIIKSMHNEKEIRITYLSKMCGTYGNKVY